MVVSATTRKKREYEKDGVDYFFLTEQKFKDFIKNGDMLEYNEYCGNFYGTLKSSVEEYLQCENVVVFEIDVNGARNIEKKFSCIKIFILPPSLRVLKKRLLYRGTEKEEILKKRMDQAYKEIKSACCFYDYLVINDSLEKAVRDIKNIISSEKLKMKNMKDKIESILDYI